MATIVRYEPNGHEYILVGAGFGASMFIQPGFLSQKDRGEKIPLAVLSDAAGKLSWVRTDNITVVTIDGRTPQEALQTRGLGPSDLTPINPDEG